MGLDSKESETSQPEAADHTTRQFTNEFEETIVCPGTFEIFYDPVSLNCGHTFEKEFLLGMANHSCPECRKNFSSYALQTNYTIRRCVDVFFKHFPSFKANQYLPGRYITEQLIPENNSARIITIFREHKEQFNDPLYQNLSLLHHVIKAGNVVMLQSLLEKFADVVDLNCTIQAPNLNNGSTLLNYSISCDQSLKTMRLLLENGADPSLARKDGVTPLIATILTKKYSLTEVLIKSKRDLNINSRITYIPEYHQDRNYSNDTALTLAADRINNKQTLFQSILHLPGIDINAANSKGETALIIAAKNGDKQKVEALLNMPGINVAARRNVDKLTAKQIALLRDYPDIVELFNSPIAKFALVKNKISAKKYNVASKLLSELYRQVNKSDFYKYITSLETACLPRIIPGLFVEIIKEIAKSNDIELLKFIVSQPNGFDLVASSRNLLLEAIVCNNLEMLKYLIENYPQLNINMVVGQNITLDYAAVHTKDVNQTLTLYLLDKGACLSSNKPEAWSTIVTAASHNNVNFLKQVLAHPACLYPDVPNKNGVTELYYITAWCDAEVLKLYINAKKNYLTNINEKVVYSGKNALIEAVIRQDLTKTKLICSLPSIDLDVNYENKSLLELTAAGGNVQIHEFLSAYFLAESLLLDKPISKLIKLDHVFSLPRDDWKLITSMLQDKGIEESQINYLNTFLDAVKNPQTEKLAYQHMNFFRQKDAPEIKLLNRLFDFAHATYYRNKNNWEYRIRKEVMHEIRDETYYSSDKENKSWLAELRNQTIIAKPRYFFTFWRTRSQQEIDNLIREIPEPKVLKIF